MMLLYLWLIVLLAMTLICYQFCIAVPEGLNWHEKMMYRVFYWFTTIYFGLGRIYSYINGKPYVVNCQNFANYLIKVPKQVPSSHIHISQVYFGDAKVLQYRNLRQKAGEMSPALIYIHGGAYIIGSPCAYDNFLRSVCDQLGCYVAALYYPLAPGSTFPAPYLHCLSACKWLFKNHQQFLIDPGRIAIAGDSVGGQIAASIVQDLKSEPSIGNAKIQVLLYASFQWIDMNTPSYQWSNKFHGYNIYFGGMLLCSCLSFYLFGWEDWHVVKALSQNRVLSENVRRSDLVKRISHDLLPHKFTSASYYEGPINRHSEDGLSAHLGNLVMDHRLSPIMGDLEGTPTAYVVSCEFDNLRDDSLLYCTQLKKAGVKVFHRHYDKAMHGILTANMPVSELMRNQIVQFLEEHL